VQQIKYTPFPVSVNKNFHYKNFHHFCVSKELGLQANVRLKARAVLTIVQVSIFESFSNIRQHAACGKQRLRRDIRNHNDKTRVRNIFFEYGIR